MTNYRSGASWTSASSMGIFQAPEQREKKDKGAPGWVAPTLGVGAAAAGVGLFLATRGKAGKDLVRSAVKSSEQVEVKQVEHVARRIEINPTAQHIDEILKPRKIVDAEYTPVVETPKYAGVQQYDHPAGPRVPTMKELHLAEGLPWPEPKQYKAPVGPEPAPAPPVNPMQYDKAIGPEPMAPEPVAAEPKKDFWEDRRDSHRQEIHDYDSRTDKQKLKDKRDYDSYVNGFLDGNLHEVNSDELIPVIHGGNSEAINAFLKGDHAYGTLQQMPHEAGQMLSTQGVMWHSDFSGRAKMYAERTGSYSPENKGEPAILMGMMPRRHLYENDIADEFSSPVWHADKLQNVKVIKQSDPEYADAIGHYKENYLKPTIGKWDRVRADAMNETIPDHDVTYGDAAQKLSFDMSDPHKFDPAQVNELKWQIRQAYEKSK